jgi:hypothetical protein
MMICCRNVPSNSPICPEGRAAQAADAGYVPCDTSLPSQCLSNYICLPSMNLPQIALCCSRLTSQSLICPNQQVLYRVSFYSICLKTLIRKMDVREYAVLTK